MFYIWEPELVQPFVAEGLVTWYASAEATKDRYKTGGKCILGCLREGRQEGEALVARRKQAVLKRR